MSKRKPLEVVRVVRDRAVSDAAENLRRAEADAARARASADGARDNESRTRHEARAREDEEHRAMSAGTSARDLAQLAAFEVGNAMTLDRVASDRRAAERRESDATGAADEKRGALVGAREALDVVEKHQQRARARAEHETQTRADETAQEAHASRFKKRT